MLSVLHLLESNRVLPVHFSAPPQSAGVGGGRDLRRSCRRLLPRAIIAATVSTLSNAAPRCCQPPSPPSLPPPQEGRCRQEVGRLLKVSATTVCLPLVDLRHVFHSLRPSADMFVMTQQKTSSRHDSAKPHPVMTQQKNSFHLPSRHFWAVESSQRISRFFCCLFVR